MTAATKATEYPSAVAKARFVRVSPRKARRVIDLVRGRSVSDALDILRWAPQAASGPVAKVIASAAANAQNNGGLDPATLVVATVYADQGPTAKRIRPRAQGRAFRIRRRTSHITVVVESRPAKDQRSAKSRGPAAPRPARPPARSGLRRRPRKRPPKRPPRRHPPVPALRRHPQRKRPPRRRPPRLLRLLQRREAQTSGPKDQSAWLPAGHHHRLEVALVCRQAVCRVRQGGRGDPPAAVQWPRACWDRRCRDRADPRPGPGGHSHRASGHRHWSAWDRGRPDSCRPGKADRQAGPAQHPGGQKPGVASAISGPGGSRAVEQPGGVPPRNAQGDPVGDASAQRQGNPGAVLGPPRRRGNEPLGVLPRGPRPAAHLAGRYRLRPIRGQDHLRPDRCEGVDLQG